MILALKTAGTTTELHLIEPSSGKDISSTWESGRTLADQLLSRITDMLAEQATTLPDLTGIVIFSGPGSFTSLRIGHTVANALADSLNIPVVGEGGDAWLGHGLSALRIAKPGRPALPQYGSEAHITRQGPSQTSKA